MSEPRLLQPHEIQAQRAWADEEGRPEIIAVFQHISILERQLAEAKTQISQMIDGGGCPRRDPNGECVELNEAIALAERRGEALRNHGGFHAPKNCGDSHRPQRNVKPGTTCFYCEPALAAEEEKP